MSSAALAEPDSQRQALPHSSSSPTPRSPDMTKPWLNTDWLHCPLKGSLGRGRDKGCEPMCVCVCVLTNRSQLKVQEVQTLGSQEQIYVLSPQMSSEQTNEQVKLTSNVKSKGKYEKSINYWYQNCYLVMVIITDTTFTHYVTPVSSHTCCSLWFALKIGPSLTAKC